MSNTSKLPTMELGIFGGKGFSPISELMRAMILRAVDDYHSTGEHHDEAHEWLYSDEEEYILSFRFICNYFEIDPEKTRDHIVHPRHRISTRRRAA